MAVDRYVKIVLTVIALELFWIGIKEVAPPVSAQAQQAPMPVVIRGIQISGAASEFIPVAVINPNPVRVEVQTPIKVEADRPLPVETVQYQPSRKPGE